jgi:hypothetical protein
MLSCALGISICLGLGQATLFTASAGGELKQPVVDLFDSGVMSDYWMAENTEIALDEGVAPALRLTNAAEGAGLVTLNEITATSARVELDVESLDFSAGGWLAFMLGTKSVTPILNWTELLGSGRYITLSYHGGYGWMFRTYTTVDGESKTYHFFNAAGENISLATRLGDDANKEDATYHLVDLPRNGGKLENISLSMSLDASGNFSFGYKMLDEDRSAEKIVAKTATDKYEGYTAGHLGFCVMQGSNKISGKVADLRTYVNNNETPATAFRFTENDIGRDYLMDFGAGADSISFVREGKMRMQANGGEAYAIHKTSATFDTNIVNSVIAKNIAVEQTVYLDSFQDGDEFCLNFGLSKVSAMQIKEEGSYAVRITSQQGKKYFDVIRYASNPEEYTSVTNQQELLSADVCHMLLEIDGNGSALLKMDSQEVAFTITEFPKNRIYFANLLYGDAAIRVDNYRMTNAIYSRPTNKDLFAEFTNNDINIKEWYLPDWGGNLEERYDGVYAKNDELVFRNVNSNAGITTIPQFSNFELKFDIMDVQRAGVDEGMPSTDIRVLYGIQGYKDPFNILYIAHERPMFTLRPSSDGTQTDYSILNIEYERAGTLPEKYNVFSAKSEGLIFNIKLTMTDGLIEAGIKLSTETEYYTIFSIQTSSSITGHIRITGYGDGTYGDGACSNFTIDNVSVKNTDQSAKNTANYGYESNSAWIQWDGYEYEDTWKDDELLPIYQEEASDGGCSSVMSGTTCIGVLLIAGGLRIFFKKDKKEEDA